MQEDSRNTAKDQFYMRNLHRTIGTVVENKTKATEALSLEIKEPIHSKAIFVLEEVYQRSAHKFQCNSTTPLMARR